MEERKIETLSMEERKRNLIRGGKKGIGTLSMEERKIETLSKEERKR